MGNALPAPPAVYCYSGLAYGQQRATFLFMIIAVMHRICAALCAGIRHLTAAVYALLLQDLAYDTAMRYVAVCSHRCRALHFC
jgi:hypothetical protein